MMSLKLWHLSTFAGFNVQHDFDLREEFGSDSKVRCFSRYYIEGFVKRRIKKLLPSHWGLSKFSSITAMCYVLHCLPISQLTQYRIFAVVSRCVLRCPLLTFATSAAQFGFGSSSGAAFCCEG